MKRKHNRVVVAMSGGVDSSLAAALLQEQGYEVIGITMNLFSLPKEYCRSEQLRSCCGWQAVEDANQVAHTLGISHYVANLRQEFEKKVISDFCEQYSLGRTPNPCIRCNQYIKFETLMGRAKKLKADYLATGHHARIVHDSKTGRYLLKKGKDKKKDQSYFLYPITQDQLSRTLMPIGDFTKEKVREKAREFVLPVAQRPESQEICFVPDKDYPGFLQSRIPEAFRSGPIVDLKDRVLGQHKGIGYYTVGQRRGMGIAAPQPLYVLAIRREKNTIVVGTNDKLYERKLHATRVNLISGERIAKPLRIKAKIRHKHKESKALLTPSNSDQAIVEFEKPQRAITPGQAVVFYDGDVVVGGGIIDKIKS
ncbi:MAG: tRNA 2-thiouridine(34) synthase MnmA [Candidatus Aminicenantes bacterium]|nr:tRNA 2-thiouridine(34) synthase MnmA [Candidatus Aminicenantes bacterium]